MKKLTWPLCIGMALLLSGCGNSDPQWSAADAPPPAVNVARVQERDIYDSVEDVARTEATARVQIRAQVTGILKARAFEEGSFVTAGDLLFEIDPAQFEADLAVAAAEVEHARASQKKAAVYLARLKGMRSGAVAAVDLDAAITDAAVADANLQQKKAQWQLSKLDLDHTRIVAPISGHIGASNVDVGNLIAANGDALATIVQPDPIEVSWSVSERALTNIKIAELAAGRSTVRIDNITARLRLSNGDEYPHSGEIFFMDNEVNPRTGTITLRARFPNPDNLLIPGQFVTAMLRLNDSKKKLLIPQTAVQQDVQGYFVILVKNDNTVEQRHLELGSRLGTDWIVNQGLKRDQRVITMGLEKVRSGMLVNPVEEVNAAGDAPASTAPASNSTASPGQGNP